MPTGTPGWIQRWCRSRPVTGRSNANTNGRLALRAARWPPHGSEGWPATGVFGLVGSVWPSRPFSFWGGPSGRRPSRSTSHRTLARVQLRTTSPPGPPLPRKRPTSRRAKRRCRLSFRMGASPGEPCRERTLARPPEPLHRRVVPAQLGPHPAPRLGLALPVLLFQSSSRLGAAARHHRLHNRRIKRPRSRPRYRHRQ